MRLHVPDLERFKTWTRWGWICAPRRWCSRCHNFGYIENVEAIQAGYELQPSSSAGR
jgi:hypothetical protein